MPRSKIALLRTIFGVVPPRREFLAAFLALADYFVNNVFFRLVHGTFISYVRAYCNWKMNFYLIDQLKYRLTI